MFIGRERELKALNGMYASGSFEFAVIYGRRRVGKTALINEFINLMQCYNDRHELSRKITV